MTASERMQKHNTSEKQCECRIDPLNLIVIAGLLTLSPTPDTFVSQINHD